MAIQTDIFNLDLIYNDQYTFSFPRKLLEQSATGIYLDNKTPYTPAEKKLVEQDIQDLWDKIMKGNPQASGKAVISAGAPGSGKTELFHNLLEGQEEMGHHYAYMCYDDVALRGLTRTYQAMLGQKPSLELQKEAYNKWRPASHYATQLIMAHLIKNKTDFFFGTTSTSDQTWRFYEFIKNRGYSIEVIHVTAPEQVRVDSIHQRDKDFVQVTDKDIVEKGRMIHERIQDTFLKYANEIKFYYRPEATKGAILAATWNGKLAIVDQKAYDAMVKVHDAGCDKLGKPQLKWAETVLKASN